MKSMSYGDRGFTVMSDFWWRFCCCIWANLTKIHTWLIHMCSGFGSHIIPALLNFQIKVTHMWDNNRVSISYIYLGNCGQCHILSASLTHWDVRKNGRHFVDDIFKCIFPNEKVEYLNEISLKYVYKGSSNKTTLVLAWCHQAMISDQLN